MRNKRRKWRLRRVFFCLLLLTVILMSGCSGPWGKEEEKKGLQEEIIAVVPQGESADEVRVIERERTRETIRYQVYCRWNKEDGETALEKCYQVTCCRRNGKWAYDLRTGIQLLEERTVGLWH